MKRFSGRRPRDDQPKSPESHALTLKHLDQQAEDSTLLWDIPSTDRLYRLWPPTDLAQRFSQRREPAP